MTAKGYRVRQEPVRWVLMVVIGMLLMGCSTAPEPTVVATRTPKPTFTVVTMLATSTPEPTATTEATATATPTSTPIPTPTVPPDYNVLTGETVADPAVLQRRPLLVRIGNDAEVRPQSGLSEADIVYEEAMDGWYITRFTAVIWSKDPAVLRPIRSARLFTIDLGFMYDGALVHSGANDQVRWLLSQTPLTDLDEYFHGEPYYWVAPEGAWKDYAWMGRATTSAQRVRAYMAKTGKEKAIQLPGFSFSKPGDLPPTGAPAGYIHIPFPRRAVVEFRYDAGSGLYRRWVYGTPHLDALNGEQLSAANVIVHYAEYKDAGVKDSAGSPTYSIQASGEGRAQLFRDGVMIEGKWVWDGQGDFCRYLQLDGTPLTLRPGQSWIEVVPIEYEIEYKER